MGTRASVVAALETALAAITTANGYATNAGNEVHVWRVSQLPDEQLPALVVKDVDDTLTRTPYGKQTHALEIRVEGLVIGTRDPTAGRTKDAGKATAALLRSIADDVAAAILADKTLGGVVETTSIESVSMTVEQEEQAVGSVLLTLTAHYETDLLNL